MGKEKSEKCEICDEIDFVEHMFFECQRLDSFWYIIQCTIYKNIKKSIDLTKYSVVLGIEQDNRYKSLNINEVQFINELLIIAKYCISKSKSLKTNLELTLERELTIRGITMTKDITIS